MRRVKKEGRGALHRDTDTDAQVLLVSDKTQMERAPKRGILKGVPRPSATHVR